MARFLFLLLVVANLAFAGHLYLTHTRPPAALPNEVNRDQLKVVSVTDTARAQRDAEEVKKLLQSLSGATCVEWSVKPADAPRAQTALAALALGERLASRNVDEFTRFAVALPVQRDRKAADALLAGLKKANVKDVLIMSDNSVSLGLFSTEDAAKRVVADLESKAASLVKGISITPKNPQARETVFTIREVDGALVNRIAGWQRDFEASQVRGVECSANAAAPATQVSTVAAPPTAAPSAAQK
jgi:hypothetical protein